MGTLRLGSSVVVPSVTVNSGPAQPVIDSLSVTPTTSQQTITAPSGVDGYSPITVDAVDNTIDSNITANNIKSGVTILGVTGDVVELNGEQIIITPTTSQQIITPTSPKNAITQATVSAVTSSIDVNITAGNIKKDVSILGVTGTYEGSGGTLITKTITQNGVYNASSDNADGYSIVTVNVPSDRKLPVGYAELEYITTAGDVYIDTGIKLANTDVVEAEFKNNDGTSASFGALYGIYALGESSAFYASGTYYGYDGTNTQVNTNIAVDGNWHKVVHDFVNGTLTIDNIVTAFTPFTFTNTVNCGLCARYGSSYGYFWKGSVKRFTVTRGSSIICDLMPAIRKSDNAVGVYDIVRNQFFNKSGSGSFSAGPEISCGYVELPSYSIDENGVASRRAQVLNGTEFTNITSAANYAFYYAFAETSLTGQVVFSDLTTISGYNVFDHAFYDTKVTSIAFPELVTVTGSFGNYAFANTSQGYIASIAFPKLTSAKGMQNFISGNSAGLRSIDFSALTSIDANGMTNFTNENNQVQQKQYLTSISFPELVTIGNNGLKNAFGYASNCTSIAFPKLTTVDAYGLQTAFRLLTSLTSASFPMLTTLGSHAFSDTFMQISGLTLSFPALTSSSFGSYTDQFNNMLRLGSNNIVHFPSNLQSVIGSWSDVTDGFGGTNTTVLFDLPATE